MNWLPNLRHTCLMMKIFQSMFCAVWGTIHKSLPTHCVTVALAVKFGT